MAYVRLPNLGTVQSFTPTRSFFGPFPGSPACGCCGIQQRYVSYMSFHHCTFAPWADGVRETVHWPPKREGKTKLDGHTLTYWFAPSQGDTSLYFANINCQQFSSTQWRTCFLYFFCFACSNRATFPLFSSSFVCPLLFLDIDACCLPLFCSILPICFPLALILSPQFQVTSPETGFLWRFRQVDRNLRFVRGQCVEWRLFLDWLPCWLADNCVLWLVASLCIYLNGIWMTPFALFPNFSLKSSHFVAFPFLHFRQMLPLCRGH